jgi:hypothetical protein
MPHGSLTSGNARESIRMLDDVEPVDLPEGRVGGIGADPGTVVLTCANCGALMDERKCKLICRCGYFLSCSDYY